MSHSSIKFETTLDLFGVTPGILENMLYGDALKLKLSGAISLKSEIIDELRELVLCKTNYEYLCEIDANLKKINKAIELTTLQLEEIKRK